MDAGFVAASLYPQLDAVEAGLFDSLKPVKRGSAYTLSCPKCHKREGYYYPFSRTLQCNRRNECGFQMSVWDYVQQTRGLSAGDTLKTLAAAAHVSLPDAANHHAAPRTPEQQLAYQARELFKGFLQDSPEALQYLTAKPPTGRAFTPEQVKQLPLGYYPDEPTVAQGLAKLDVDMTLARAWGLVPTPPKTRTGQAGRVVGFWGVPDGTWRLVGRAINPEVQPKYLYTSSEQGFTRALPYHFAGVGAKGVVCIEGMFDCLAYQTLGVPACALGGDSVTDATARLFLAKQVRHVLHVIDGDVAGRRGAVRTIVNCERLGIPTLIGIMADGEDPDSLRQAGKNTEALSFVNQAVSGGEFLARYILSLWDTPGPDAALERDQAFRRRALLTPSSEVAFALVFQRLGLPLTDPKLCAARMTVELVAQGMEWGEAQTHVRRRYGVEVAEPIEAKAD